MNRTNWICVACAVLAANACDKKTAATDGGTVIMTADARRDPPKLELSVTAEDFALDYAKNKVAADVTYKGKRVELLGALDPPGDDASGLYVDVRADRPESWLHTYTPSVEGARCYVEMNDEGQKGAVSKVRAGSRARVTGTVVGPVRSRHVVLEDCVLDVASLGTEQALTPTIPVPRKGSAAQCAAFDACCPANVENKTVAAICATSAAEITDKRKFTTCGDGISMVLIGYETAGLKAPAGCVKP